jgi:hypothetical protein
MTGYSLRVLPIEAAEVSHPSDKNKSVARMGHGEILLTLESKMRYTPSSWRMASAMASAWWCMEASDSASIITRARASVPL